MNVEALLASPHWRWMPGMLTAKGWRLSKPCTETSLAGWWTVSALGVATPHKVRPESPDLSDPATLGCLLALVREAWGDPCANVTPERGRPGGEWACIAQAPGRKSGRMFVAWSETEALVAALLAAPLPTGGR